MTASVCDSGVSEKNSAETSVLIQSYWQKNLSFTDDIYGDILPSAEPPAVNGIKRLYRELYIYLQKTNAQTWENYCHNLFSSLFTMDFDMKKLIIFGYSSVKH